MSAPPNPALLEQLGKRPFAFYPPVVNVEHNEWHYVEATWSEVLVENTKSAQQIWIPRRLLGAVSRIEEPVMIVGLVKEMEYKAGALWPHERRVLEMPRGADPGPASKEEPPAPPPTVLGVRMEASESRIGWMIGGALAVGLLLCVVAIAVLRGRTAGTNVSYVAVMQEDLGLGAQDDYYAVVRRLGDPSADRWQTEAGTLQYRVLEYPKRNLNVILMGKDRQSARYVGTLDANWKVVHSVGNTRTMLQGLKRF